MPSDSVDLWELQSVQCKRSAMDPTTVIYTVGLKVCLNFSHRCLSWLDIDPNRYCSLLNKNNALVYALVSVTFLNQCYLDKVHLMRWRNVFQCLATASTTKVVHDYVPEK